MVEHCKRSSSPRFESVCANQNNQKSRVFPILYTYFIGPGRLVMFLFLFFFLDIRCSDIFLVYVLIQGNEAIWLDFMPSCL